MLHLESLVLRGMDLGSMVWQGSLLFQLANGPSWCFSSPWYYEPSLPSNCCLYVSVYFLTVLTRAGDMAHLLFQVTWHGFSACMSHVWQLPMNPASGDPTPSPDLCGHLHACDENKTHIHIKFFKVKLKKNFKQITFSNIHLLTG